MKYKYNKSSTIQLYKKNTFILHFLTILPHDAAVTGMFLKFDY